MKGTEKQVKYAEDIKARFFRDVMSAYGRDKRNVPMLEKAFAYIESKYDDAMYWIEEVENRDENSNKHHTAGVNVYFEAFSEMSEDPEMQKAVMG